MRSNPTSNPTSTTETRWAAARRELEAVALVRDEDVGVRVADRPFLRFHPTLPFAARPQDAAEGTEARFVAAYFALAGGILGALQGKNPAGGMAVARAEEPNLRRATAVAFGRGARGEAAGLAQAVGWFLEFAGRPREQARWAAWVRGRAAGSGDDEAALNAELDHAWGLLTEGRPVEAVALLKAQQKRLAVASGSEVERRRALCARHLGRALYLAGRSDLAVSQLETAVADFRAIGDSVNESAALGDHANALRELGELDAALAAAERGMAIDRGQGNEREIATALGQTASILSKLGRHAEADARYDEALTAARRAGDAGIEATTLAHQGSLADDRGDHERAVTLYREALARFEATENVEAQMQTSDLLGTAEQNRGNFLAARAWYDRARALAERRGDRRQLAGIRHNTGTLLQVQAEALPAGDTQRPAGLREARTEIEAALAGFRELHDDVNVASSLFQLGTLARLLGDLDAAERLHLEALTIRERLRLPDVWKIYRNLEDLAQARGDTSAAAAWRAKKEAKQAELKRLAGDAPQRLPAELLRFLTQLAQSIHQHASSRTPAPPELREALAQMSQAPAPWPTVSAFFSSLLAHELPPVPTGLPPELADLLGKLREALARP